MAEVILKFQTQLRGRDDRVYGVQACGRERPDHTWEGWLEFTPVDGSPPVISERETTQPNRDDLEYWATGLTDPYLDGALLRALTEAEACAAATTGRMRPSAMGAPHAPPPPHVTARAGYVGLGSGRGPRSVPRLRRRRRNSARPVARAQRRAASQYCPCLSHVRAERTRTGARERAGVDPHHHARRRGTGRDLVAALHCQNAAADTFPVWHRTTRKARRVRFPSTEVPKSGNAQKTRRPHARCAHALSVRLCPRGPSFARQPVAEPLAQPAEPVHQQPRLARARQVVRRARVADELHGHVLLRSAMNHCSASVIGVRWSSSDCTISVGVRTFCT
jgi:hypothetical protein